MVQFRIATAEDAASLLGIYAPYITATAISFETTVPSIEEFGQRIEKCLVKFPWIVCEIDGRLAGYAYASVHREREAYQWTCECSVYVSDGYQGRGIAMMLYETLLKILEMQGLVNVYAGITLPNEASVKLHEKCGFVFFALYDNIGFKLGKWQKVGWWKRQLHNYTLGHAPPLKFSEMDRSSYSELFETAVRRIEFNLRD